LKKQENKSVITALSVGIVCILIFAALFMLNSEVFTNGVHETFEKDLLDSFVEIIDVGQGDSILIYSDGYSALIDTGLEDASSNVCKALNKYNIDELDVLLITHLDFDHTGSVAKLTELYKVTNLILPELSVESEGLTAAEIAINRVAKSGGEIYTAKQGMNFEIGKFEITVLAAFENMNEENNRSVITMAELAGKKFLFTGDMEAKCERAFLKEGLDFKCDVLKVAHHGSASSSIEDFLNEAKPKYAAISVGADNPYGHPHKEVLARLDEMNCEIYRTDLNGNIIFTVENKKIKVATDR